MNKYAKIISNFFFFLTGVLDTSPLKLKTREKWGGGRREGGREREEETFHTEYITKKGNSSKRLTRNVRSQLFFFLFNK